MPDTWHIAPSAPPAAPPVIRPPVAPMTDVLSGPCRSGRLGGPEHPATRRRRGVRPYRRTRQCPWSRAAVSRRSPTASFGARLRRKHRLRKGWPTGLSPPHRPAIFATRSGPATSFPLGHRRPVMARGVPQSDVASVDPVNCRTTKASSHHPSAVFGNNESSHTLRRFSSWSPAMQAMRSTGYAST